MKNEVCCFTGHREIPQNEYAELKVRLKNELEKLIAKGVIYYGAGGAYGFDTLAAQTVLELKKTHPEIKLILVLPCKDQTKCWREPEIQVYEQIKQQADKVKILAEHYYNGCMQTRNRALADNSGYCVCYMRKPTGGTAYTVKYAEKLGLEIIRL